MQTLKEQLEETISVDTGVSEMSDKLQLLYDSRGLIVRLAVRDFFPEGEVEVPSDLRPLLEKIGRVMNKSKSPIRIEGHSDATEASLTRYPTDWELSSARAAWVARYWTTRLAMDPRRVSIAGYSHFHPIVKSREDWFKGGNRRIEILLLNDRYAKLERSDARDASRSKGEREE
jgi:chemotaxis protein MotB